MRHKFNKFHGISTIFSLLHAFSQPFRGQKTGVLLPETLSRTLRGAKRPFLHPGPSFRTLPGAKRAFLHPGPLSWTLLGAKPPLFAPRTLSADPSVCKTTTFCTPDPFRGLSGEQNDPSCTPSWRCGASPVGSSSFGLTPPPLRGGPPASMPRVARPSLGSASRQPASMSNPRVQNHPFLHPEPSSCTLPGAKPPFPAPRNPFRGLSREQNGPSCTPDPLRRPFRVQNHPFLHPERAVRRLPPIKYHIIQTDSLRPDSLSSRILYCDCQSGLYHNLYYGYSVSALHAVVCRLPAIPQEHGSILRFLQMAES